MLALAIPLLGYGAAPTLAALGLYAILPILEGAITGFRSVPGAARDSARGVGFAPSDVLWRIDLPLALPFILAGLRSAVIINIGTATIGSTAGALSLARPSSKGSRRRTPPILFKARSSLPSWPWSPIAALRRWRRLLRPGQS